MQYVVSLLFASRCYFHITQFMFFFSYLIVCILVCIYVFNFVLYIFCLFFFCVLLFFPTPLQVYRPLPPGGSPIALGKCNIVSFLYTNNIFFIFKDMLSLPIPTHRRGLKVRHFVLFLYIYIYIYVCLYIWDSDH